MECVLDINSITKVYKDFTLSDVSFAIPKGTIMGFIGENGAGKTTTMRAILNLISVNSGSIAIFGKDMNKSEKAIKSDLGVILDESGFPEYMKVKDVNMIMKDIHKNWDEKQFFASVKRFDLPLQKRIKQLSKGMKMKLMIIIAMSHHAKLLILDEPTSGLDPIVRDEILDMFLDFIQDEEHSILFSSHITSDIEKVCDYITCIHKGRIMFSKGKDELLETHGVIKGNEDDLSKLPSEMVVGVRRNSFGCEILINDKEHARRYVPTAILDPVSLEEIMLYMIRGERK